MLWLALFACMPDVEFSDEATDRLLDMRISGLGEPPIDTTNQWSGDASAEAFGRVLFFEPALSPSGDISCATCHDPDLGWSDGERTSNTLAPVNRHAPSLWNLAWSRWQFWDGRCDSLWCQAAGPFENPAEMGSDRAFIAHTIADTPALSADYEAIFGALPDLSTVPEHAIPGDSGAWAELPESTQNDVTAVFVNTLKAIAAYERLLVSPASRFDTFAEALGEDDRKGMSELTAQEQQGAALFADNAGCWQCHLGPTLSNREFHNIGLGPRDWLVTDVGRHDGITALRDNPFNSTGEWSDDPDAQVAWFVDHLVQTDEQQGQFKTPGLRNVATSAPYMHGGHFDTLAEVVDHYDLPLEQPELGHREESIIPLALFDEEKEALVAFLATLTSEDSLPDTLLAP